MSQGRAAVTSLESQRKGDLGDRFRGLALDELPLPVAPLLASVMGTLRRCWPWEEKGVGVLPAGTARSVCFLFIQPLLQPPHRPKG